MWAEFIEAWEQAKAENRLKEFLEKLYTQIDEQDFDSVEEMNFWQQMYAWLNDYNTRLENPSDYIPADYLERSAFNTTIANNAFNNSYNIALQLLKSGDWDRLSQESKDAIVKLLNEVTA